MNLSEVLAQARQNQRESGTSQRNQYSTKVQPPKKLPRNQVDQKVIQAFLKRQRDEQKRKDLEAGKKKAELLKLRDASKTTRKANSMAKRTKDNLKVYKGEDLLGLYPDPKKRRMNGSSTDLTPEEDRRHKAFMKSINKVKVPGISDNDSDAYEPLPERDERKRRKMEKQRVKSRSASNLEFGDLLKLAEEQKNVVSDSSSQESESENESDGDVDRYGKPLSVEEKYYREKRKNRELEERLKMTEKKPSSSHDLNGKPSKSLSNFKIGKLNPAMSDDAKRAKVKALMESFNKSSHNKQTKKPSTSSNSSKVPQKSTPRSDSHSRESTSKREKRKAESSKKSESHSYTPAKKPKPLPPASSMDQTISSYLKKQEMTLNSLKKNKIAFQKPQQSQAQNPKKEHSMNVKKPNSLPTTNGITKKPVNPYKHTVVKNKGLNPAKRLIDPWAKEKVKKAPEEPPRKGKCTLSVTSEEVRTNYPGVAKEDPYIQAYKKTGKVIQNFTPETIAQYKAHMIRKLQEQGHPIPPALLGHPKRPVQKQRYGVILDNSDDEYDPELQDFIAEDDEEEEDVDVSSHIKQIFGYDKNKYGRESEWELSKMDASYKDIEKEEKRSLRIAKQEDALEAKLEEERMKRKASRKR